MLRTSLAAAALSLVVPLALAACTSNDLPGGACGTCAEIYTNGGIVCSPSASYDAYQSLDSCACGTGPCAPRCTGAGNFCTTAPATQDCSACLADSCAGQLMACAAN